MQYKLMLSLRTTSKHKKNYSIREQLIFLFKLQFCHRWTMKFKKNITQSEKFRNLIEQS